MTFQLFVKGERVYLKRDPEKRVYKVIRRDNRISRGPMGQFPPDWSYVVEDVKWGGFTYFRSDSLKRLRPLWTTLLSQFLYSR